MSQHNAPTATAGDDRHGRRVGGGVGGPATFAGVLLVLVGVFHAVQGLVAVTSDTFFAIKADYLAGASFTTWGWAHIVIGVVAAAAGAALLRGAEWARGVAVIVATISMFASFLWIPYYPVGALVMVALNIFVMWAAFARRDEFGA